MADGRSCFISARKFGFRIVVRRCHQEDAFGALKGFGETAWIFNAGDCNITALGGPGTSLFLIPDNGSNLLSLCQKIAGDCSPYLPCHSDKCKHDRAVQGVS
jgi:hypothetical protein